MNLNELHKRTVQSFIKGREQQSDSAWNNSQIAKKAWLGNSRKTGIWDPVVPRVVGQIGKIGQHDDALLRTASIFDKRSEQAKTSANKAKLRLSGKKTKREDTMQNEEYTQVLEQMILTLTGMELEQLHEAVVGHLTEMAQTRGRYLQVDPKATIADLKRDVQGRKERAGKPVIGMHGRVLAPSAAAYYKKYPRARGTLHDSSTAGDDLN